jgi:hypothetical protein
MHPPLIKGEVAVFVFPVVAEQFLKEHLSNEKCK